MIDKILNSVNDFETCIRDKTLKVCFLHPNSKISKKGWNGFVELEALRDVRNSEYNLGISLVGQEYPGEPVLTCIDIDGDKTHNKDTEKATKEWVYQILKQKLNDLEIPFMAVKSSSGGYHLYLYTRTESTRYESTKGLQYPENRQQAGTTKELEFLTSGLDFSLKDLYGEKMPHSIVEIWCKNRYMVAPGSDIWDQQDNYIGTVELLEDGVQTFKEIGIIDQNLNDVVREAFLENGFKEDTQYEYVNRKHDNYAGSSQYLSEDDINGLGEFLLEYLPKIDGQKHTFCLAFGGFLHKKGINIESIKSIGEFVVKRVPQGFFKNNEAFIDTLCHDTAMNDPTRLETGLPTVEEILEPYCSKELIGKKLHLLTNPIFHKFWPNGRYASQYPEVVINYVQNYMTRNIIQTKINKDGELQETVINNTKVLNNIEKINYIDDISGKEKSNDWERPVQVTFSTQFETIKSPVYQDCEELFAGYRKMRGAHGSYAKGMLEDIYNEFESLNLIDVIESSTRSGIWVSRKHNTFVKYIDSQNGVELVTPELPLKSSLKNGLQLLIKIKDAYPWKGDKFGVLCRMALTMPYSYIIKSYGTLHPSIILYGEAGTLKTSAGQLVTYMNGDFSKTLDTYIISGGELNSEYRFGKIMDTSSFPLIVNEPEQLFQNVRITELIKDAVTGDLIRNPGGKEGKPYYSHRSAVYTMNALPSTIEDAAYLRRFITIFFDRDERGDTNEVMERLEFLNINGVKNERFKELQVIGDYTYYILHKNPNWLTLPLEQLQTKIITSMEQYTDLDLSFMKVSTKEYTFSDRSDQENYTLSLILKLLRSPYLRNKGKYFNNANTVGIVKDMISSLSDYSYIHEIKGEGDYILLDIGLKNLFNEYYGQTHKNITLKGILNYLSDYDIDFDCLKMTPAYVYGTKKQVRGIKMSLNDFIRLLTGKEDINQ